MTDAVTIPSRVIETPASGFEDLIELGKIALPDPKKDPDGEVAALFLTYREYLRGVGAERREAPLLAAARHVLRCSRASGRPQLGGFGCKTVMQTMLPKMITLCHPEGEAYPAVVSPYHDNGLFANVLQVYDALLLSDPQSRVLVDWRRKGTEGHFQYGPEGFDLWNHLFDVSERCQSLGLCPGGEPPEGALTIKGRISCIFMNMLRGYVWTLPEPTMVAVRNGFASAVKNCLRPTNRVQSRVDEVCAAWGEGAYVVGVHKRLGTPEVAAAQLSQRAPSVVEFITKARKILAGRPTDKRQIVFLASDDSLAVAAFEKAFPAGGSIELCCRSGVKRTEGGVREDGVDNEVHRGPCEAVDAEDALVDALCLCRCDDFVCIDSNLSIFVALTNPKITVHALSSILPEGWEEAAARPEEAVYATYEVIFEPMVFVRGGPSAACELMGAKKKGEVVRTTGRAFDGWIELEEGGWMLVDAERQAQGRGQGLLLRPAGTEQSWTPEPGKSAAAADVS